MTSMIMFTMNMYYKVYGNKYYNRTRKCYESQIEEESLLKKSERGHFLLGFEAKVGH